MRANGLKYFVIAALIPLCAAGAVRPKVKSIDFQGDAAKQAKSLRKLMGTKQSGTFMKRYLFKDVLIRDLKVIEDYYFQHGFLEAQVADVDINWNRDSSAVEITINAAEGRPVIIDSITIIGMAAVQESELRNAIRVKAGDRLDFGELSSSENNITRLYGKRGFLSASVSRNIEISDYRARISFEIAEGRRHYLGAVIVSGNEKTKLWYILREMPNIRGKPLTVNEIDLFREQLYRQGLHRSVNLELEPTETDSVFNLLVYVTERDAGEFSLGGGYGSEDNFRLKSQAGYTNIGGRGIGVGFEGRISIRYRMVKTSYHNPALMRSRLFFRSGASYSQDDRHPYNLEQALGKISLGRIIGGRGQIEWGYIFKRNRFRKAGLDTFAAKGVRSSLFYAETVLDLRDSKIRTRNGLYFLGRFSVAEPRVLGETGFLKTKLDLRGFLEAIKPVALAFQLENGAMFKAGERRIPVEEFFFFSGRSTVRGYKGSSLGPMGAGGTPQGGRYYYILRGEARFDIWKALKSKIFIDNGGLFRDFSAGRWEGSSTGAGMGLAAHYGLWTARIEYAWKVKDKIYPGRFYLELGQSF